MSVARMQEIVKRMRALGVIVHEEPGCWSRGNGQSPAYEGILNHHTATGYANTDLGILIHGRPDLDGPLCNFTTWANGDLGVIAAFPANHAGASGGYNTAPLPATGLFNCHVIGNEIAYPGSQPMTPQQRRTSLLLSKVVVDVCGGGNINRVKGHCETSITGKWDPGYAPGKTIDMNQFRADAARAQGDDDMPYLDWDDKNRNAMVNNVADEMMKRLKPTLDMLAAQLVPDPAWKWKSTVTNAVNTINSTLQDKTVGTK
jgi:N-acetylmuramoyl-L-alanine amidase